jgi:hypothetical protein
MTDDQQFILALLATVLGAGSQAALFIQAQSTHRLVNGLHEKGIRNARARGVAEGSRRRRATPPGTMGEAGKPPGPN